MRTVRTVLAVVPALWLGAAGVASASALSACPLPPGADAGATMFRLADSVGGVVVEGVARNKSVQGIESGIWGAIAGYDAGVSLAALLRVDECAVAGAGNGDIAIGNVIDALRISALEPRAITGAKSETRTLRSGGVTGSSGSFEERPPTN